MKRYKMGMAAGLLAAVMLISNVQTVPAAEEKVTEITTVEQMQDMANNPDGNYKLMADLDMSVIDWVPFSFEGTFDGNGHTLYNLTISSVGKDTADTYDGNMKVYDTYFAGMFSRLMGATVENLNLVNVKAKIENEKNSCFVGSVAGYSEDGVIKDCTVSSRLYLSVDAPMFGVGGVVGYGNGKMDNVSVETTLVCIDTNKEERDEQFMGGAFAGGYMDVDNCIIRIDGYDSDHGYVHNGGIAGIYIFYPSGKEYYGSITNNTVTGMITFFEDNTNRRAYCKFDVGEVMNWDFAYEGNAEDFTRNEVFDYSVDLLPDSCETPDYEKTVLEPTENSVGYTTYTCKNCGYSYTDDYRLYEEPKSEDTQTTEQISSSNEKDATNSKAKQNDKKKTIILVVVLIALVLLLMFVLRYLYVQRRHARRRKNKKK